METIESRTIKVIEHLHTVPRGNIPVYQVLLVQELKSLKGLQGDSDQVLSAQWVGQAAIQRALTLQQPPVDKKFSSLIPGWHWVKNSPLQVTVADRGVDK